MPPVQGSWNEWADWSDCSAKCNGGIQTRRRSCDQEPPVTERSIPCVGNTQEWRMCNTQVCKGMSDIQTLLMLNMQLILKVFKGKSEMHIILRSVKVG